LAQTLENIEDTKPVAVSSSSLADKLMSTAQELSQKKQVLICG